MTIFVDTSAFYAVFDRSDPNHLEARETWNTLLRGQATLLTTNYVLLETAALLQHRIGIGAVRSFHQDVSALLQVDWVTRERHHAAMEALLAASRKKLSLVDCLSFQTMRRFSVHTAFCFDRHFSEQGFSTKP